MDLFCITKQYKYLFLFLLTISLQGLTFNTQGQTSNCNDYFNTELVSFNEFDTYLTIELKVEANDCGAALSHYTIEVPCGTVAEATNSEGWSMELNSTDPTTNIYGLKVDDIANFGEDGASGSFTVKYSVYFDDEECLNELKYKNFTVAYKAATCVFTDSLVLSDNQLEANLEATSIVCYGANDGRIDLTVTNGTSPYQFAWSNGATTKDISNLPAGDYSVIITDATGATITLEAVITEPETIRATASIINTNCGQADGSISTEVTGGIEPYTYAWSTGDNSASVSNLSEGTYTLTLSDAAGCVKTLNYTIAAETDLTANISSHYLECYEDGTGSLIVEVSGGTEPYTYLWDNGETSASVDKLSSGTHQVTITDANGCSITQKGYVILKKLNITSVTDNPVCNGASTGSITISISNGTEPYNIQWSNGETGATIDGLTADWYQVNVTDEMGCSRSKYIKISEPEQISLSAQVSRQSCQDADSAMLVTISASGGTAPYEIYYENEAIDELVVEQEGYYDITAVDANGCSVTEQIFVERPDARLDATVSIQQPTCDQPLGAVSISIEQGTEPYNAVWQDGPTGLERNDMEAGEYVITIEDAVGCSVSKTVTINAVTQPSVTILSPEQQPTCNSTDNILRAVVEGATTYTWSISDETGSWVIQEELMEQLLYTAGEGQISISLIAENADGCTAQDMIVLSCSSEVPDEDDSDEDDSNDGSEDISNCENTCFDIQAVEWYQNADGCYTYKAKVITDGSCQHDLSHLTVQVDNGTVQSVSNSENWETEKNMQDPTTTLYGFKVDDISNFGHTTNEFELDFTICSNAPQTAFVVAYKAAQCVMLDTLTFNMPEHMTATSYPNPFVDNTNIVFTAAEDGYAILNIYNVSGELVECLYEGPVNAETKYSFTFKSRMSGSNIYFYQLKCGNQTTNGKLIQTRY